MNKGYQVFAYCEKCGKLLTKSKIFSTKADLINNWDELTAAAPLALFKNVEGSQCVCKNRDDKAPVNFEIKFKIAEIHENGKFTERNIESFLTKPKLVRYLETMRKLKSKMN